MCNACVKFGAFYDVLDGAFDAVVSGHYVEVGRDEDGRATLRRSRNNVKDQTYFLVRLSQTKLSRAWFPVGALTKAKLRAHAHALDLANRARPDSQGICFLGRSSSTTSCALSSARGTGRSLSSRAGARLVCTRAPGSSRSGSSSAWVGQAGSGTPSPRMYRATSSTSVGRTAARKRRGAS